MIKAFISSYCFGDQLLLLFSHYSHTFFSLLISCLKLFWILPRFGMLFNASDATLTWHKNRLILLNLNRNFKIGNFSYYKSFFSQISFTFTKYYDLFIHWNIKVKSSIFSKILHHNKYLNIYFYFFLSKGNSYIIFHPSQYIFQFNERVFYLFKVEVNSSSYYLYILRDGCIDWDS